MRIALTISAVAHVLMWGPIALPRPEPLVAPAETPIMAEIVSAEELDEATQAQEAPQTPPVQMPTPPAATSTPPEQPPSSPPKREDQAPNRQQTPKQKATKLASASPSAQSAPQAAAKAVPDGTTPAQLPPPAQPQAVQPQVWGSWLDSALSSPLAAASTGMDPAEQGANLAASDIAKFKAHLQGCWKPPERLVDSRNVMVVLRVSLQPNGALTAEPALLAASGSEDGVVLMKTAMQAVRQCQPYGFLPSADYKEWKVLDLAFSPTGLTGLPRI